MPMPAASAAQYTSSDDTAPCTRHSALVEAIRILPGLAYVEHRAAVGGRSADRKKSAP